MIMFNPILLKYTVRVVIFSLTVAGPVRSQAQDTADPETMVTVSVAKVLRRTLHSHVTCYGTVETAPPGPGKPAGGAQLAAATSGLVIETPVVEGMHVEQGSTLVRLDSRSADAAESMARAAVDSAEKALVRQKKMEAVGGTSERALQEVEERLATARADLATAQLQRSQLSVIAPVAGTIVYLDVEPGEWLDAGRTVVEIINADRLVLTAQVSSSEIDLVRTGQTVDLYTRLGDSETPLAQGTVQFVSPRMIPNSNGVQVRITLPPAVPVRSGQFLAAKIVTGEQAACLVVPSEAVFTDLGGHSTLSLVEGDVARKYEVETGIQEGGLLEVRGEVLREGATVVTRGSYALPEETRVKIVPTGEDAL